MGKRELLLVAGFLLLGAIVYQASAPPPAPGETGFSFGRIADHFRRGLRANRASVETSTTTRHPVAPAATSLRVFSRNGALTIVGEDRPDIESEILVRSNGEDDAEARRLAEAAHVAIETTGPELSMRIEYPVEGTQRTLRLTLKVPARLRVILQESGSPLSVAGIEALELSGSRGEARIRDIRASVTGGHRNGDLTVSDSGAVQLDISGSDTRLQRIRGDLAVKIRGGELRAGDLGGTIEVDSQGCDVTLDQLRRARGLLSVTAVGGSVSIADLQTEARLDVRNTEVRIDAAAAAPLTIRSEGEGSVEVTPAAGGFELDATTSGGDLTLTGHGLIPTVDGDAHHAAGPVRGGGPLLRIRTARADIVIRER